MTDENASTLATTLNELAARGLNECVVAGSWARRLGASMATLSLRPNDLDIVIINGTRRLDFRHSRLLARHHHPFARQNDLILQLVDPVARLRIDLFLGQQGLMGRSKRLRVDEVERRVVDPADDACALTRLCWPIVEGHCIPEKYFAALAKYGVIVPLYVWSDYRPQHAPLHFQQARELIMRAAANHPERLVPLTYSQDVERKCRRCVAEPRIPLADPRHIQEILGYV